MLATFGRESRFGGETKRLNGFADFAFSSPFSFRRGLPRSGHDSIRLRSFHPCEARMGSRRWIRDHLHSHLSLDLPVRFVSSSSAALDLSLIFALLPRFSYWEKVFNMTVAYRSALVGTIYMKTLRLSSVSAREVGQVSSTRRLRFLFSPILTSLPPPPFTGSRYHLYVGRCRACYPDSRVFSRDVGCRSLDRNRMCSALVPSEMGDGSFLPPSRSTP